jgi:hypothetical protein
MSQDGTAGLLLAEAQVAEKNNDWLEAVGKRAEALDALLGRTRQVQHPQTQDPTNDLEALGVKHQPTKQNHNYLRHYWRHLRDHRFSAKKVVEVGVQTPRSINMWEEFFPNATIYGLDIDPVCKDFEGGRKKVFIGDQMDETFLNNFITETGGDFDVVIDDGLHTSYSMLKTFSYLYPAVQSHGVYVIEDIQRQPEIIDFLRMLMHCVNFYPDGFDPRDWPSLNAFPANAPWMVHNTASVAFHRYIAFIERGFNPGDNRFLSTPEAFHRMLAERRAEVLVAVEALKREGVAITRDNLCARLDRALAVHVDRYMVDRSRGLAQ